MNINKNLNKKEGLQMINSVFEQESRQLKDSGKTVGDFGGGYVEALKTKAKVVLYFGFDRHRNRCQIVIEIDREDILLWLEAIAERIWNTETSVKKYSFVKKEPIRHDTTIKNKSDYNSSINIEDLM